MFTVAYGICALIVAIVFIYMSQRNYNTVDIYQWTIMVIVPIIVTAYWLKSMVMQPESAYFLYCFVYLDSTILVVVLIFTMLNIIGVRISPWVKILAYGTSVLQLGIVCLCSTNVLYYSKIEVVESSLGHATNTTYGPLAAIHFVYLGFLIASIIAVIVLGLRKKGDYDRMNLMIYASFLEASVIIYFVEVFTAAEFTILPFLYTAADVIIAVRYDSSHRHDLSLLISEHQKHHQEKGYIAVGFDRRFLGTNEKCYDFLPFLKEQKVNEPLMSGDETGFAVVGLIDEYEINGKSSTKFQIGGMTCVCEIAKFAVSSGGKQQGYLLELRDATEEQRAYDIIADYNERMDRKIKEATDNIRDIQQKVVLGLANMIENRDNNTGGHVKRTSDIIHIIVDEIKSQGRIPISDEMALDIVRAAPTHDLGKISISNEILNKPGKLTDEEYEIMKTHSEKSGEIVKIILEGVEEERFVEVAYNVARYHHERWDGRGYPEGLVGTMIPLEARIMAIADVYDALVSKRVYKEPMSFEKSASIMCECMGTQFDPNLESVFLGCREQLEEYYRENDN